MKTETPEEKNPMNKHILLVMNWLKNPESVSKEELVENHKSAAYAAKAAAANAAYDAAYAAKAAYAAYAKAAAADAASIGYSAANNWVNEYFTRSSENREDYEKEALDLIDTAPQQLKSLTLRETAANETPDEALDSIERVEWSGEGLPPVGVDCEVYGALGKYNGWQSCRIFAVELGQVFITNGEAWVSREVDGFAFRKPETKEAKKEREELETAYDFYCEYRYENNLSVCSIGDFHKESGFELIMHIVRKTGYRKGE